MELTVNGKTVDTKYWTGTIEPEKVAYVQQNFYTVTKEQALIQLRKVLDKKTTAINHIYGYYFERIAGDGKLYHSPFSINEMLDSAELTQVFINKTYTNEKVFSSKDLVVNVKTAIRLGGKGLVSKLTNFPFKECVKVLETLAPEGGSRNCYIDPCCGWGVRLLASAYLGINYIGFDVNPLLIEKLTELQRDIQEIQPEWKCAIIPHGSEYYRKELDNFGAFAFTSPPYFGLEDYTHVNEFGTNAVNIEYTQWVSNFVYPLMQNLSHYVRVGGIIGINIKNYKNYTLEEDFCEAGVKSGLKLLEPISMKNPVRVTGNATMKVDNSERVFLFERVS